MANPKVIMDIEIAGASAGRIVFELFADTNPKSAENFRALCTGEKGNGKSGKPLHYRRLHFQQLASGEYIWAFGIKDSIYGTDFEDKNKHHKGTLSMGRFQSNKCNSGFFICFESMDVVQAIENCRSINGKIYDCVLF